MLTLPGGVFLYSIGVGTHPFCFILGTVSFQNGLILLFHSSSVNGNSGNQKEKFLYTRSRITGIMLKIALLQHSAFFVQYMKCLRGHLTIIRWSSHSYFPAI